MTRSDHSAIQNVFHVEGLDGIDRLLGDGVSHYSFRKALRKLREAGVNGKADEFEEHLFARGVLKTRHKPSKPSPGETRPFKVQQGRGTKYLRLPVDESFPDHDKGDVLNVTFGLKHIEVDDDNTTDGEE